MNNQSDNEKKERYPIDEEFLEIMHKIKSLACKLSVQESNSVKIWLGKLTGTNPLKRNEYAKCLHEQVKSGKLEIPFTEIPPHFLELPPLHEALHGPIPNLNAPKTTTWRSTRSKADIPKQMTQKELKAKYGTDRFGLHTCLRHVKDFDNFTVHKFVALAGPYTKDGGALLVKIMQEELQEFRTAVKSFYDGYSTTIAEQLGKEQVEMKEAFKIDAAALLKKKLDLEIRLKNKNPDFDWASFRRYNKVDSEQKTKLKKLKQLALKLEERNTQLRRKISELQQIISTSTASESGQNQSITKNTFRKGIILQTIQ